MQQLQTNVEVIRTLIDEVWWAARDDINGSIVELASSQAFELIFANYVSSCSQSWRNGSETQRFSTCKSGYARKNWILENDEITPESCISQFIFGVAS
ncbi:MAG: hypothetical protein OXG05_11560 [Gammaproteobacteria bacterium]|nr:hypothetical protein [Gammaproteobacteria bacterium]